MKAAAIAIERPRNRFSRVDYIALRAFLIRYAKEDGPAPADILERYYSEDERAALDLQDGWDLRARLDDLRDLLIARAAVKNPHLAESLRLAKKTGHWSAALQQFLVSAAEQAHTTPLPEDALGAWFKARLASCLQQAGLKTLGQLRDMIKRSGPLWWRRVPRVGAGKAAAIVRWLRQHAASVGEIGELRPVPVSAYRIELNPALPAAGQLVPLEKIGVPHALSGHDGINRRPGLCMISAPTDLDAIEIYLANFEDSPKTLRAYKKELERFLLFCILELKKPLSSALLDDLLAYKRFLAKIPDYWIGPRAQRRSAAWKPFASQLTHGNQSYALNAVGALFAWLQDKLYLSGNPVTGLKVKRPPVSEIPIQVDRALPELLWFKLTDLLEQIAGEQESVLKARWPLRGRAAKISLGAQCRAARAAILLLGNGLRCEEAARVPRSGLSQKDGHWVLLFLGKRSKWRSIALDDSTLEALQAHWADRGHDWNSEQALPLLAPIVTAETSRARARLEKTAGYTPNGVYHLVTKALGRIAACEEFDLTEEERKKLQVTSPHAFRHTYGRMAVRMGMQINELQLNLGHESIETTGIYTKAEDKQRIVATEAMHAKMKERKLAALRAAAADDDSSQATSKG